MGSTLLKRYQVSTKMVWFQCEDCGENLKKPKLQNHFRICSAYKLSCIDCGFTFNKESVQAHTQCVSEQEKYGPKGEGKGNSNSEAKEKAPTSQNCDVDLSIGLSTRPPWSCSVCNVKATSRETLLLHSEGKKHRSKARAFQANKLNQNGKPSLNGSFSDDKLADNLHSQEQSKIEDMQREEKHEKVKRVEPHNSLDKQPDNKQDGAPGLIKESKGEEEHSKKRKRKEEKTRLLDTVNVENKKDLIRQQDSYLVDTKEETSNAKGFPEVSSKKESKGKSGIKIKQTHPEFVQATPGNECEVVDKCQREDWIDDTVANANGSAKEPCNLPVKWKKIIKSVLKSSPDGSLRIKKLQKEVIPLAMKALESAGVCADEDCVKDKFMNKVLSSSMFVVDKKVVRLA
ncbi:uncharacterized protein LOC131046594 isoform X1 [Cryptomeria japonica]|uniref:uncharacterized protein LOC131046594 isoform X1 n=2 Tax=Cryptomeria japonica TaxID=3369 RepID=UPI0027DAB307|nr:uncharacterized protein LOC131046594 isoform X1 [Cryptomeria japonica]